MIEELARYAGLELREVAEGFEGERQGLPLAQKRTSRSKAPVRVAEREIYKGPYPARSVRLINNLRFPALMHGLEEELRLPDSRRGVYRWRELAVLRRGDERRYYLIGDNVGRPERMRVHVASTAVDQDFRVVERETLVRRVSEIEKVPRGSGWERHPDFDPRIAVAALQHLYFRALLGIGDSGTHNILVREDGSQRLIAGIDFDEQRMTQAGRTLLGHLFKQEHGYLHTIYGPYLARTDWLGHIGQALETLIDDLDSLCERWVASVPPSYRPEGRLGWRIRAADIRRRNEQLP